MTLTANNVRWDGLFHPLDPQPKTGEFEQFHADKNVLVTGAGGSIGSALATALSALGPRTLFLLDSSEQNLFRIHTQLSELHGLAKHVPILGSVTDERFVADIFERFQPEIVYHAAAFKHVPLMEMNPFAAVQNNVFGTFNLALIARRFRARRLVMISTDKAVNPHSIMGASKRMAELVLLALENGPTHMTSIRLGNVLGSEGSVVPLFLEQIQRGGPVTVTHPEVERYFLGMDETVACILRAAAASRDGSGVCFPEVGKPIRISDLARYLIERASAEEVPIIYTGLRPGDKLREEFVSDSESMNRQSGEGLQWIDGPRLSEAELEEGVIQLSAALDELSLPKFLAAVTHLVPEYQPSESLRNQVTLAAT